MESIPNSKYSLMELNAVIKLLLLKISLPLFMNIDQFSAQMSLGELYLENGFDQESMDGFIFQCF